MDFVLLLKGLIAGFAVAAPVGPIGILCLQRTLHRGPLAGLAAGIGAASADAFWGLAAGYGIYFMEQMLTKNMAWIQPLGAFFLLAVAAKIYLSDPQEKGCPINGLRLLKSFTSTFFLALTSPATIIAITAIFIGLRVGQTRGEFFNTSFLVLGVFIGSSLWWLILSGAIGIFHARIDHRRLIWVNRISATLLLLFSMFILFKSLT